MGTGADPSHARTVIPGAQDVIPGLTQDPEAPGAASKSTASGPLPGPRFRTLYGTRTMGWSASCSWPKG